MSQSGIRLHLSSQDQDAIIQLWNELAEFPASSPQEALDHCLRTLSRQIGAVNAMWVGAVREKNGKSDGNTDLLLGWRPRTCIPLNPTDEWQLAHEMAMAAVRDNYMDPQTVALVRRAGENRCHLREDLVSEREWRDSRIYREVLAPLDVGHRLMCASATSPTAESYLIFDRERRAPEFGARAIC
jgi:hypothetical protein